MTKSRFWAVNLPIIERLADAPGFIRRMSLTDGLSVYLIAFWRSVEDARAFTKLAEHRAAVQALYRDRILFSHFVGLWRSESLHPRHVFCPTCAQPAQAPVDRCPSCGQEFARRVRSRWSVGAVSKLRRRGSAAPGEHALERIGASRGAVDTDTSPNPGWTSGAQSGSVDVSCAPGRLGQPRGTGAIRSHTGRRPARWRDRARRVPQRRCPGPIMRGHVRGRGGRGCGQRWVRAGR